MVPAFFFFFFFNDTATTEIYTLSLHDALPIWAISLELLTKELREHLPPLYAQEQEADPLVICKFFTPDSTDRKSTRLNSSHSQISYAVFCLKKKKSSRE